MIIVDEGIHAKSLMAAIADWYPGQVTSITALRRGSIIKDDSIPALLRTVNEPTFITINVSDFWLQVEANRRYCLMAFDLPKERAREIPTLLRQLLQLPEFKTKAARMGKVVRITPSMIEFYTSRDQIQTLVLPPTSSR